MKKINDGLWLVTFPAQNSRYNPDVWTKELQVKEVFTYGPGGCYVEANKEIVIRILWTAEHGFFAPKMEFYSHNLTLRLQKIIKPLIGCQNLKAIMKVLKKHKVKRMFWSKTSDCFEPGKDKNK